MAGIEIRFEIDDRLGEALGRLLAAGTDLTPAMKDIANHLEAATRLRFEAERAPGGQPWQPSQRVLEDGGQTLSLSGDLKGSIVGDWGPDFAEVGPERSFGAAVYAAIHQFGGTIRPKVKKALAFGGRVLASVTLPARPYLGFEPGDAEAFAEILRKHFRSATEGGAS
jgi:phage virion morphogenesis protein